VMGPSSFSARCSKGQGLSADTLGDEGTIGPNVVRGPNLRYSLKLT
jgi:hypothetical protein